MRKVVIASLCFIFLSAGLMAQDSTAPKSKSQGEDFPDMMGGFKEMQKRMEDQMKKFFGDDGSQSFSFKMDTTFMNSDTSFSKSFGFMFDGKNWKSLTPGTEGGNMGDMFKQMEEKMQKMMPNMREDDSIFDLFKGFGNAFGNEEAMPRVQPKDKKRKGDEEAPKNEKYKTEKL